MFQYPALWRRARRIALALVALAFLPLAAQAADPIRIGFSMGLTGANAPNGKQLLEALEIWRSDINAKGGLLGRPVEFVYYDDQTLPPNEPAIYTKLIEVDKVDLLLGPYGTNQIAAGLPVIMQHKMTTVGILGTAANHSLHYPNYFAMVPLGEDPLHAFSSGFFEIVKATKPKPKTIALVGVDAEFGKNSTDGARDNAKAAGLTVVYDRLYPPSTTDFAPVVRAIQATNPDVVFIASYPPDSVGIVRAISEIGYTPKMIGGTLIGMMATPLKMQMGPLMNGYVIHEDFVPAFHFPGAHELLVKYQAIAKEKGGIDPLGYGFVPFGYAAAQVLGQAVEGTKSLDQEKIAGYIRSHKLGTVVGDIEFGKDGEWKTPRFVFTQWQHLTGSGLDQLTDPKHNVIVWPAQYQTGTVIYPYAAAKN
ncbi:MAG TPA: amino acid ABC transporter substrate-binding protein [Stellaceae bacterium]|nr:amino acid ABC transporter substrate-binding protein [Stellaceae bacterium]